MNENLENLEVVRNLEKMYEKIFTRKGMGSFMKLAWNNVKKEYSKEPHILEVCVRLMIEELLIYAIAIQGKKGYEEVKNLKAVKKIELQLKPYHELETYYKNYIDMLKEYFKNNPEKESEIFVIED